MTKVYVLKHTRSSIN